MNAAATDWSVPALFGRDDELGHLRDHLRAAQAGQGSLVLIAGEAGIGKTSLSAAICREAVVSGALVLSGGSYDLTTTPPYGPWAEIIAGFPHDAGLPPPPAQLRAGGGMAGIDSQAAFFDAAVRFLTTVAAARPLLLLLEDLHWADAASLDLLRFASRSLSQAPILLLATYRDDEIAREHSFSALLLALVREGRVHRLHLQPLKRQAVLALVRERYLLPPEDEERLLAYLLRLAEGNPFFTKELLYTLAEHSLLGPTAGAWGLSNLAHASVPSLVQQVIDGRLARLDADSRMLLDRVAVIGFDAPLDILQELYRDALPELDRALQEAIQHHVLTVGPSHRAVHFSHALVRQAIYEAIPLLRRQTLHRRVGELLAVRARANASMVANHFFEAGDERALEWSIRAAELAQRLFAPQTVIVECDRAISLANDLGSDVSPGVYRMRGWAWNSAGDVERALLDYDHALALARGSADRHEQWQSLLDLGTFWAALNHSLAGGYCRQAVELARTMDDPAALGHSLNRLGNWHMNAEQPSDALRYHDEALQSFAAIGDERGLASTLDLISVTHLLIRDVTQALRYTERSIPLLRQIDDRQTLSSALANVTLMSAGWWASNVAGCQRLPFSLGTDARDMAEEAIRIARDIGWRAGEAYALGQMGMAAFLRGDLRSGFQTMSDALGIAEDIQHSLWISQQHLNFGSAYLDLHIAERARWRLQQALHYATVTASSMFQTGATALLASASIQQGDFAEAERLLRGRNGDAQEPALFSAYLCWFAQAELLLARDRPEHALQAVDRVLASIPDGQQNHPAHALRLRGEILLACGRLGEAEAALDDAMRVATTHRFALVHWRALALLRKVYLATGRAGEATTARSAALAIVNNLAAQIDDSAAHQAFLRYAHAQLDVPLSIALTDQEALPSFAGLTQRELDVLRQIVEGLSDREIAERLFISHRTVMNHVSSILGKLDVTSRTAAATLAIREGLVRP